MTNKHHTVLYIGMTDDLERRVSEHRIGEIPGFTASYRCKKLVSYEHCTDVLAAIAREKQLKRWSRSKKMALITTMNPHWRDLAPEVLGEEQEPALIRNVRHE
jgi:putative endonuclease